MAKACPQNPFHISPQTRQQMLQPLRAEILHLICGFHEPNEATRAIVENGVSEEHRCPLSTGLTPMMREILWVKCCNRLPARTEHTSFPEAMKALAPDCFRTLGPPLSNILSAARTRDCKQWPLPQSIPAAAAGANDAFIRAHANLSKMLETAFALSLAKEPAPLWSGAAQLHHTARGRSSTD